MRTTTALQAKPSLYCCAVIRTMSAEADLMRAVYPKGTNIFGCNHWEVFSDIETWLETPTRNDTIEIHGQPATYNGALWLNCDMFFSAWDKLMELGNFANHDWTVKVDPDAVFVPERLRQHLAQQHLGWNAQVYVKNCEHFKSMQGPLDIFSQAAVAKLRTDFGRCRASIPQDNIGEDGFMQKCMEFLQIGALDEYTLLEDLYCGKTYWGQRADPCTDQWKAAFHPYKTAESYTRCLSETQR